MRGSRPPWEKVNTRLAHRGVAQAKTDVTASDKAESTISALLATGGGSLARPSREATCGIIRTSSRLLCSIHEDVKSASFPISSDNSEGVSPESLSWSTRALHSGKCSMSFSDGRVAHCDGTSVFLKFLNCVRRLAWRERMRPCRSLARRSSLRFIKAGSSKRRTRFQTKFPRSVD